MTNVVRAEAHDSVNSAVISPFRYVQFSDLRKPLRMSGYARLVIQVLDQIGVDHVDVLGYSWGGALAQQLAHDAPSRILSRSIPDAQLRVVDGGHRFLLEQPADGGRAITAFLQDQDRGNDA